MENTFDLGTPVAGVSADTSMDGMVFDLSDVSEPSFELLPKGTYNAVVEEVELTTSKAGSPMLVATYTITDGEFAERKLYDYFVLSGKGAEFALPKLKAFLNRVCPEVNMGAFNPAKFAEEAVAVGKQCQLKITITTQKKGEYKGEKRNSIQEVLASANNVGSFLG